MFILASATISRSRMHSLVQNTVYQGYFYDFEMGGRKVLTNVWGGVNMCKAQFYISKY